MNIDSVNSALTPLLFGAGYVAVTIARSYWLWRVDGTDPYVIDHDDPLHRYVAQVFVAVIAGLFLYFGASAIWPSFANLTGPLDWAINTATRYASATLMLLATIWTGYAQFYMGNSWRIGIPQGEAPMLRTSGPFAISRNPIFLGKLIFVFGMTLWSPNAVTMSLLVATYIALEVQIRSEEIYLEHHKPEAYRDYRARVRRWI